MNKWKKEKPYKGKFHTGCLYCGPKEHHKAKMNTKIVQGFANVKITRNGKTIFTGVDIDEWDNAPTLMKFENIARKDPNNDWRYINYTPLHGEEYQRQGRNNWVLIDSNIGFA